MPDDDVTQKLLTSVHIGNGVKTANAIREAIVCTATDWLRCNYVRQSGWSGEGVKFSGCVREREEGGLREIENERESSPFWAVADTNPIVFSSTPNWQYPRRWRFLNYASASGTVASKFIHPACFHREARPARFSFTWRVILPSSTSFLLAPSPSALASFSSSRLRNLSRRNVARLVSLAELRSFPFSGSYPSYPFSARTSLIGRAREEKETISTNPTITVNAHYNILMMSWCLVLVKICHEKKKCRECLSVQEVSLSLKSNFDRL